MKNVKRIVVITAERINNTPTNENVKPEENSLILQKDENDNPQKWVYISFEDAEGTTVMNPYVCAQDTLKSLIFELGGDLILGAMLDDKEFDFYDKDTSWFTADRFYDKDGNYLMEDGDESFTTDGIKYSIEDIEVPDVAQDKCDEMFEKISLAINVNITFTEKEKDEIINYLEEHLVK